MTEEGTSGDAVQNDAAVVEDAISNNDNNENGQPAEPTWSFADGIAGDGDAPEWFKSDKYKTVSDQAKAYKDLESRFGSFTGSPEEYTSVELSEELKELGIEIKQDDPLIEKAIEFAKSSNMDQEGFNKMVNLYAETQAAEQMALEDYKKEQLTLLGDNAQQRIDNLNSWASANIASDMIDGFQAMAQSAESVKALERLVAMTRAGAVNPNGATPAGNVSAEEVQAMQFEKDEYGNRRIATDTEFRKRFQAKMNALYGTEDHVLTING